MLDYLTMAYCLDHDIPILGFCRGSQMLCVVSVATMIQDFPVWFASHNLDYNYEHRREISEGETYFDYTPHDVNIASDSHSQICSPPRR
ncbi:MAG: gamma-glutamyl-gamma-aminobutyrate hydrolase family protein [Prevotella sp.]|nr:gamma-glutamyl-gamma-aminobutyrate hydrolase family protein [Prevotella sp.]